MEIYRTEEEQAQSIKSWLNEYGKSIAVGIAFGIVSLFSWNKWQDHRLQEIESASRLYAEMLTLLIADDTEDALRVATDIIETYRSTNYAVFADLILAKYAAEADELEDAERYLRRALEYNAEPEMNYIIRFRLVRILLATDKLDEASRLLNMPYAGFSGIQHELLGDLYRKQGQFSKARESYMRAMDVVPDENSQKILKMKLSAL